MIKKIPIDEILKKNDNLNQFKDLSSKIEEKHIQTEELIFNM